jgi:predicted transcriptional regulator
MGQQEVFNYLNKRQGEFLSTSKIAQALHTGESSVLCSLRKLLKRGDIKKIVQPKRWIGEHSKAYYGVPTGQLLVKHKKRY